LRELAIDLMSWVLNANSYILFANKMAESGLLSKYLFVISVSTAFILRVSFILVFFQDFKSESSLIANEKYERKRTNMKSNRFFMKYECKKKAPMLGLLLIILG
tara:strand:+ start:1115 stop:1426 length:312 start_codon:yes stop_codon:yes gene_type:complete